MRLLIVVTLIVGLFCVGCNKSSPVAHRESKKSAPEGLRVVEPVTYGNLTIFPVVSPELKNDDRFITLDEGLKAGTVEILELGAGNPGQAVNSAPNAPANNADQQANPGESAPEQTIEEGDDLELEEPMEEDEGLPQPPPAQPQVANESDFGEFQSFELVNPDFGQNAVNTLTVVNRSDKPLYLMPGEIIVGGSQDRTIGRELVIKPDGKPVAIDVFCVEHGRWGGRSQEETVAYLSEATANATRSESVALAVLPLSDGVAEVANQGKFIASVGQLNKAVRLAVQDSKDQGKVWDEVSNVNSVGGVQIESGAFTANYVTGHAVKRLEPYIENLNDKIAGSENIVGVVVAINGKVETMDVFESTPLFKKLWPKLLKSYALDAANVSTEKDAKGICSLKDAGDFMSEAFTAGVEESNVEKGVATSRRATETVVTFSASDEAAPADAEMNAYGGAGFGGGFHTTAFSK